MNQTYLLHTPSSFFFRLTIPVDLRFLIGKRELRWSLKTGAVGIAKQKARLLAGNLHHLFRQLRQERPDMTELTTDNIQRLIEDFKAQAIGTREDAKIMAEKPLTPRQITTGQYDDEECLELVTEQLARCDYGPVTEFAAELLTDQGIAFDKEGIAFKTFRRSILRAQQEIFDISIQRSQGIYSAQYAPTAPKKAILSPPVIPEPKAASLPGLPIIGVRAAVEEWFKENTSAGNWRDRSIKEYRTTTNRLVEFFGEDKHPGSIMPVDMKAYKDFLGKLPTGYGRRDCFKGMSLAEIVETTKGEDVDRLTPSTINKNLITAGSFFKWCRGNGYATINPAEDIKIKQKRTRPDQLRDIFDDGDLQALFHSEEYVSDTFKHPYQFFFPVFGLFTGCRINEIAQLNLADFEEVEGVWTFKIPYEDEADPRRRGKTNSSERIVPLPSFITDDLNLIGYIETLRSQGETRLWPELPYMNNSYGHAASKWFGTYRKRCGVTSKKKVFHSFRHTLTDHLKQKMVNMDVVEEFTGHALQGEGASRYGKKYIATTLYTECTLNLDYAVELGHLTKSRFVVR